MRLCLVRRRRWRLLRHRRRGRRGRRRRERGGRRRLRKVLRGRRLLLGGKGQSDEGISSVLLPTSSSSYRNEFLFDIRSCFGINFGSGVRACGRAGLPYLVFLCVGSCLFGLFGRRLPPSLPLCAFASVRLCLCLCMCIIYAFLCICNVV
ncbi:hypothetical protein DACRYDRAFT_92268 [Dacryopinax primogenitus]|uniref:Uncharacterized protein n=1 Tax=Dacryopinax primogenitus (strain DJM 731) TaxID=1858805 RepID=M5GCB7_DACPD|nr:uncharacterized protein DACRYDRAFT_92268 [Dacryopinax primogenitus]EJU06140.1 hypothetical protein DACRYDRAFT_92268 [Dacryopinax primogenitus]